MATIAIYNQKGDRVEEAEVSNLLFDVAMDHTLVHEAVVAQTANARTVLASTKTRGDVRGGGRKPWRQKGTGRARHGSIRSPLWRGGGVTFGPTVARVFGKKMNRKAKRKALAMVLTDALKHDAIVVVDSFEFPEGKTKQIVSMLQALPHPSKRDLIVVESENRQVGLAARNLPAVSVIPANAFNIVEALKARRMVLSKKALAALQELFT